MPKGPFGEEVPSCYAAIRQRFGWKNTFGLRGRRAVATARSVPPLLSNTMGYGLIKPGWVQL